MDFYPCRSRTWCLDFACDRALILPKASNQLFLNLIFTRHYLSCSIQVAACAATLEVMLSSIWGVVAEVGGFWQNVRLRSFTFVDLRNAS